MDGESHLGTFISPNLGCHFLWCHAGYRLTVYLGDFIQRLDASLGTWGIFHNGHNLAYSRLGETHDDAYPTEATLRLLHKGLELFIVHIQGVLVPQGLDHAVNGTIHQLYQGYIIHILGFYKGHGANEPACLGYIFPAASQHCIYTENQGTTQGSHRGYYC